MRTTRSSSRPWGVCLSAFWDTPPVWVWRPPSPQVWAWRPPWPDPQLTPWCGPGDPPPCKAYWDTTCKACWDTTPWIPARHAGIPLAMHAGIPSENITLPQTSFAGGKNPWVRKSDWRHIDILPRGWLLHLVWVVKELSVPYFHFLQVHWSEKDNCPCHSRSTLFPVYFFIKWLQNKKRHLYQSTFSLL